MKPPRFLVSGLSAALLGLMMVACNSPQASETTEQEEPEVSVPIETDLPATPTSGINAEDLALFQVSLYPGSGLSTDMADAKNHTDGLITIILSRQTTDALTDVKTFYEEKVTWSNKAESESGVSYILKEDGLHEGVNVYDEGERRIIVITKIIDERDTASH